MRILLINQDATIPPRGYGGRSFHFYKKLSEFGHRVELMCASNTHLNRDNEKIKDVHHNNIISVFTLKYKKSDSIIRIVNWMLFTILQILFGLKCYISNRKYDVVYYSSPSLIGAIGGFIISKLTKSKFVFEFRDIWPLTLIEFGNYNKNNVFILMLFRVEKFMILHADLIISPLSGGINYVNELFGRLDNVVHITNGVDLAEVEEVPEEFDGLEIKDEHFNVAYTGSLGEANRCDLLIEIAKKIEHDNIKVTFHVAGSGLFSEKIKNASERYASLKFYGSLPKDKSIALVKCCNASIILWHSRSLYRYGISANKIYEYMACGSPIISVYNGERDPVIEEDCGVSSAFDTPSEIASLICELASSEREKLACWGENGKRAARNKFDYRILSKKLEIELLNLTANSN